MLGIISLALNLTWKILFTLFVFGILKELIKNGKGVISKAMEVIAMAIKTGVASLERWLFEKYKKNEA